MLEEKSLRNRPDDEIDMKMEILFRSQILEPNNKVVITGVIEKDFELSHEVLSEKFYRTKVKVKRKSGVYDHIPVIVSNLLLDGKIIKTPVIGKWVEIAGGFRSCNQMGEDGQRHLLLYVFPKEIRICEKEEELQYPKNVNLFYCEGFLCKEPIYRVTTFGRQIVDLNIAINRMDWKSDYIPCIMWGRLARWTRDNLTTSNNIMIVGRIQSREYHKKNKNGVEKKTAYEVSIERVIRCTTKKK